MYRTAEIRLEGPPVSWSAPVVTRRGISFSPKLKKKKKAVAEVKSQYFKGLLEGAISLEFYFYMPIPKSLSVKKKEALENTFHLKTPDVTNLQKFAEDCLTGIVFKDDKQVCCTCSQKIYSKNPRTVIQVYQV